MDLFQFFLVIFFLNWGEVRRGVRGGVVSIEIEHFHSG